MPSLVLGRVEKPGIAQYHLEKKGIKLNQSTKIVYLKLQSKSIGYLIASLRLLTCFEFLS